MDRAEDRAKFGRLLDSLKIKQPAWKRFSDITEAKKFAETVGYPVLVRPSYVLSGVGHEGCLGRIPIRTVFVDWSKYQPRTSCCNKQVLPRRQQKLKSMLYRGIMVSS